MTGVVQYRLIRPLLLRTAVLAILLSLCCVIPAAVQFPAATSGTGEAAALSGSRPSGPASDEVLSLTLENVEQLSLATFGLKQIPGIPNIVGPFSFPN